MKIVGVIPARYESSRFPGKPLADICGKPMIWWVYRQVQKVKEIDEVYVATDDVRIVNVCKSYNFNFIITKQSHPDHISRVHEVSQKINAELYLCINGDEPLIEAASIKEVIDNAIKNKDNFFTGAYRYLTDPAETLDPANIKIITNKDARCIYLSRNPIPFPKNSLDFKYKKYMGIECFSKAALDFFVASNMGDLEKIEDIDHLRYIEHNMNLQFVEVHSDSISVDTPKDLEKVRQIISTKIRGGGLKAYSDNDLRRVA